MKSVYCPFCIGLIGLAGFLVDRTTLITLLPLLYLGALCISAYAIYDSTDFVRSLFRPSSIMVLYVSSFFYMGALAFRNGLVLMDVANQFEFYYYIDDLGTITLFFLCALSATLLSRLVTKPTLSAKQVQSRGACRTTDGSILLSAFVVVLTPLIEIPLPGGAGSFSSTFYLFGAIHIAYVLKVKKWRYRICVYGLLGGILGAFFYSDRRLLFYYGFILCFIEAFDKRPYRLKTRTIAILGASAILLVTTNIAMSIHRGVGDFGSTSMVDAFAYVDDYLASDWAQTMLLHNFEGPATLFHSYNTVQYMMNCGDYRLGLTFAKIFFLPVPRGVFPEKPRSMVDEYTSILYPAFRDQGGSWVPNFYAEAFWNFGFLGGLLFLFFAFHWFDTVYLNWLNRVRCEVSIHNVFFLASLSMLPFLFRGSGFDLYGLFVAIFFFMAHTYASLETERPLMLPLGRRRLFRFVTRL